MEQEIKQQSYYKDHVEKYSKKHTCETCGGTYTLINKSHHIKSQKHQFIIKQRQIWLENMQNNKE